MRWLYILLVIPIAFLIGDYRTEPPTATGSGWSRDSVNAWWGDSSGSYTPADKVRDTSTVVYTDSISVIRGELRDTSTAVWNDSASVIRSELSLADVRDTINTWWADSQSVMRAEMTDSAEDVWNDSFYVTHEITSTWQWDGGNIIAADGQKLIATDDAEDDSLEFYIQNDTATITASGIPLVIGEAGLMTTDSLEAGDLIRVGDGSDTTIILPTSVTADSLFGKIDTTETDFTTYVSNNASGTKSDTHVIYLDPYWSGASQTVDSTTYQFVTNGANDNIFTSSGFNLPCLIDTHRVILDSIIVGFYTGGVEDSLKVFFLKVSDGASTTRQDSSAMSGTAGGAWGLLNVLGNADYTMEDNYSYHLWARCKNDGASDIRVECGVRVVYHAVID